MAFGPPTVVMGALFSHLGDRATAAGVGFGRALGVNTLGAAAAPALFGVLAVPRARAQARAAADRPRLPRADRAPRLVHARSSGRPRRARWRWRCWRRRSPSSTSRPAATSSAIGKACMAAVSVVEDADGVARLRINNRQQEGSSATLARRRPAGVAAAAAAPCAARARCSWVSAPASPPASAAEDPDAAGRRRRAPAGGDRGVGALPRACRRRPARGCT